MKAISLVLCAVLLMATPCIAEAKDYKEIIGPYEVSFKLPDEIASQIEVNKTFDSGETLDGTSYNQYEINLLQASNNQLQGWLYVWDFNSSRVLDLDGTIEYWKDVNKKNEYTCVSAHRVIDGHEGYIVHCLGGKDLLDAYVFGYLPNDHTYVVGMMYLDWDTEVLPFLKSLHVREL